MRLLCNVNEATLYINGNPQKGTFPRTLNLEAGRYRLGARASGYTDWEETVTVNRDTTIRITLRPNRYELTIRLSIGEARILVDGKSISGSTVQVDPGRHIIEVEAAGYEPFTARITVNRDMTISARFIPIRYRLTVQPSVKEATIYVDGNRIHGYTTEVEPGGHRVEVEAPKYHKFTGKIQVVRDMTIPADLRPIEYKVDIRANVNDARIAVENADTGGSVGSGRGRLDIVLQPGLYVLQVSAPGYKNYSTRINVNGNETFNVRLIPEFASVSVRISSEVIDNAVKDPFSLFILSVDGKPQSALHTRVEPGKHRIKIASGGWALEKEFSFQPGMMYEITLSSDMAVESLGEMETQKNAALSFDGNDDYVALPAGFSNFEAGVTVSVWAYPKQAKSWGRFIDLGNGSSSDNILFARYYTSNDLAFEVYENTYSGGKVIAKNALVSNTWQHLVATLDGKGNVILYKDGQKNE